MKINKQHIYFLLACISFCGCADHSSVSLSLDFSKQKTWRYSLTAAASGTVASADTQRAFSSVARCTLFGTVDSSDKSRLHAAVGSVAVSSDILSKADLQNLVEQAKGVRLVCALNDGVIVPEDSSSLPLVRIGEWDLFKDLAKTVPALPKIKVRTGSAWEREKTIPLETKHGTAAGHLFQSFSLDSLFTNSNHATLALVRWKFTYQVELKNPDTAGMLDKMPTKGSGTGNAIINVTGKTLQSASIHFVVPEAGQGGFKISLKEDVDLQLMK
ncbi:MAG TPA: hypothetical protein VLX68_03310 [Chitinivibrionales bacterium]|nr:hypothetical protein [Chitinivibrionales bacterium]